MSPSRLFVLEVCDERVPRHRTHPLSLLMLQSVRCSSFTSQPWLYECFCCVQDVQDSTVQHDHNAPKQTWLTQLPNPKSMNLDRAACARPRLACCPALVTTTIDCRRLWTPLRPLQVLCTRNRALRWSHWRGLLLLASVF